MTSAAPNPVIVGANTFEALRSLELLIASCPPAPENAIVTAVPLESEVRLSFEPASMVTLPAPVSAPYWFIVAFAWMVALPSTSSVPSTVSDCPAPTFKTPLSTMVPDDA